MADYLVTWQIDIEADSYREAAEQALVIQRDPDSTATVFDVHRKRTGHFVRVDLQFKCLDCETEFATADGLNEHVDAHHNEGYGDG